MVRCIRSIIPNSSFVVWSQDVALVVASWCEPLKEKQRKDNKHMGLLEKLFGNTEEDIQKAQEYVETQRYSGLTRHYNVEGVQDSIEQRTGVSVTKDEARAIVDAVREQNCWEPATHLD